jgi:hypothetical protein
MHFPLAQIGCVSESRSPILFADKVFIFQAFNFMVVMITPVSFSSIKYKTYIIFAAM